MYSLEYALLFKRYPLLQLCSTERNAQGYDRKKSVCVRDVKHRVREKEKNMCREIKGLRERK